MPPDPIPRNVPVVYRQAVWPPGERTQLTPRTRPLPIDLVHLVDHRQTRRSFSVPISLDQLSDFLWLTCRSRSSRPSPYGPDQESRAHPSAGSMHPIHVLVCREAGPWERYDPVEHALLTLPGSAANATEVRAAASDLVEVARGLLFALVAEPGRSDAKYVNCESLVWRDAGVVLGYMSVVAEALNLSFCPLGITGSPLLGALLAPDTPIHGAGLAVLGAGSE